MCSGLMLKQTIGIFIKDKYLVEVTSNQRQGEEQEQGHFKGVPDK
jgi:hypothetical protein